MKATKTILTGAIVALTVLVSGCAKTKLAQLHETTGEDLGKPTRVLVQDFTTSSEAVKTSSSPLAKLKSMMGSDKPGTAQSELAREVADALSTELCSKVKDLGFDAVRVGPGSKPAKGEIIIMGRFVNIDEGNAVRRAIVGFGAGQSSVDSEVSVQAPGSRELIGFKAHADSGNMPGAAVTAGAGAAAQAGTAATTAVSVAKGGAKAYQSATSHQASEIADKISSTLSTYATRQGWIKPKS